jgi:hypothetical protein
MRPASNAQADRLREHCVDDRSHFTEP